MTTVSGDCSTALESLRKDSSADRCSFCMESKASVPRMLRTRVAPSSCEQKERHRPASVIKFREQLYRFRIARFVFEKN